MSYPLTEQEARQITSLSEGERVSEFLRRIPETGEIWTLGAGEELIVLGDDEEHSFVVVWPHPEYGQLWYAETDLDEVELVAINAEDFAEEILPGLDEAEIDVVIFPTHDGTGAGVESMKLREMILGTLARAADEAEDKPAP
jgi:hypothetical protein